MYSELIIRPKALSETIVYPETARKMIAEALDGVAVPKLFFNRHDNGQTIGDRYHHPDANHPIAGAAKPPVISFDGGKGFVRIFGLGEPGRTLINEVAPIVSSAIAKHVGGTYGFNLNEGMCQIENRNNPILYSIRRIVATKNLIIGDHFKNKDPRDVSDSLRRIILSGLISQARWLDENSGGASNLESLIPDEESSGFHIADGRQVPIAIKAKNYAFGFADLTFSMNLRLEGPWQAGKLRSHGYGRIRKVILKGNHD